MDPTEAIELALQQSSVARSSCRDLLEMLEAFDRDAGDRAQQRPRLLTLAGQGLRAAELASRQLRVALRMLREP